MQYAVCIFSMKNYSLMWNIRIRRNFEFFKINVLMQDIKYVLESLTIEALNIWMPNFIFLRFFFSLYFWMPYMNALPINIYPIIGKQQTFDFILPKMLIALKAICKFLTGYIEAQSCVWLTVATFGAKYFPFRWNWIFETRISIWLIWETISNTS